MIDTELQILRRAYARHVYFASRADDPRLETAFAETPREAFMGPGPWSMPGIGFTYRLTPNNDLHWLYQDTLVGLIPEKGLNNGQPSFLAFPYWSLRCQGGRACRPYRRRRRLLYRHPRPHGRRDR